MSDGIRFLFRLLHAKGCERPGPTEDTKTERECRI